MATLSSSLISPTLEASGWLLDIMSSKYNLIQTMAWEEAGAAGMQLTVSQFRFFLAFIFSLPAACGLRLFKGATSRHLYSLLTGLALVYYPFGSGVLQAVFPSVLTYCFMAVAPRSCGTLAWLVNFPYLIWLHVINASGSSWSAGQLDFTGADMTLVLKLISIAVCYQDSFVKDKERLTVWQKEHAVYRLPSLLEYLSYIFCLGNLLAGPYLEFSVYTQFIELKGIWDPKGERPPPPPYLKGALLAVLACSFMAAHVVVTSVYDSNAYHLITTAEWYPSLNILARWGAIAICGLVFEFRFYFAWLMSEAALTMAGINFIGWDEKGAAKWGRMQNANVLGMWLAESARIIPANWNIQTGVFLRHYVYERLTPHKRKPGFFQLLATQITSAVWHGLYPGYLIYFLSTVFFMQSSTVVYKLERAYMGGLAKSPAWRALKVIYVSMTIHYMCAPFIVLDLSKSMVVWGDVNYLPWAPIAVLLLAEWVVPLKPLRDSAAATAPQAAPRAAAPPPQAAAAAAAGVKNGGKKDL